MKKHIAIVTVLLVATPVATAFAQSDAVVETEAPRDAPASTGNRGLGEALWITGVAVFVPTYVLTGIAATTLVTVSESRSATIAESWIPIVGPWIMLGDSAGFDTLQLAGTAISGVLQAFALASFIAGIVLVNDAPADPNSARVSLLPGARGADGGLSLTGAF